ncbi:Xaa-Pro peptidase family protein [Clostridium sp. AL.422]|uniref:Xaa-Pro peptidase family protein n=1 Tax=Clostridium TaxID=1485 RepID=UPI00293DB269|nr:MULTISPECIES: Xaa-Pro peptidase family protein [unclassified Clostridium]MDV4150362.1 Xaa-Pro peptidase family protein [Clostridium sp. AL.422]
MARHIENIKELIKKLNIDGILIKSKTTKKYLDTLEGSGVQLLITKGNAYAIMDGRYVLEAMEEEHNFIIIENTPAQSNKSHFDIIYNIFKEEKYSKLGIESSGYSIEDYQRLNKYDFEVSLVKEEINEVRIIKDQLEIEIIKEACNITDNIFSELLKHIKVGISENEINAWLHYYALNAGASKLSFNPVITSGPRTALPHGRPTERKVQAHEPIMIDFGIEYKKYQSDMTRMVFIGEPSKEIVKIYNVVQKAQQAGVEAIKEGVKANYVDSIVRSIIDEAGYGEKFSHGLGHGIGIGDGSEYPFLNQTSQTILKNNMIMSCEPGIYIQGLGGIRIEDDVLISNGIGVPLNRTTKEMIILEE